MHTQSASQIGECQSYLLRLWRVGAGCPLLATLIDIATPGVCRHFVSLDELQQFLIVQNGPVRAKEVDEIAAESAAIVHQTVGERK